MEQGEWDTKIVVLTQFATTFTWTYVYVFMPFYIQQVSPYGREATLLWTGLILGVTGLASTVFAPIWGAMAAKFSPKRLYEAGMLLQGVFIALMGFTTSLPFLFILRLLVGCIGGLSTLALIIISSTSSTKTLTANVGLFQSVMTTGQITGPFVGAISADLLGFRATFLVGGLLMVLTFFHILFRLNPTPVFRPGPSQARPSWKRLLAGWLVCFATAVQIVFLPSILPEVLASLQVAGAKAIRVAGLIVFASGITAALGAYCFSRLAVRFGRRRVVAFAGLSASLFQLLLGFAGSVGIFTLVRVLQTGLAAAVIPIIFAEVAEGSKGSTIGFINTSRFAANAAGPFLATWALARFTPMHLYIGLSAITALSLVVFSFSPPPFPSRMGPEMVKGTTEKNA
ncbi:MAG: MFS transporter [candidate division NC10 bacterium]|nr:MFS transporter [candidate division NC10 bacterium]